MTFDLRFAGSGKILVPFWRLLSLLDEAMQQYHLILRDAEEHPGDAPRRQFAANFPQTLAESATDRQSKGPTKLDFLNIFLRNSRRMFL